MDQSDGLTSINLDDLVGAFGSQDSPRLGRLARALFQSPARAFARQMLDFDRNIQELGLVEAARITERLHVRDVQIYGAENIPSGPFLALSNHPGMTDTLALFASLQRQDLRAIALNRPFLASLPHLREHLLFLESESASQLGLIRAAVGHLRNGGAVLTFPAGRNERDPDIYPDAAASLEKWIDSASVFVRLAPETAVLPVCVRGVLWGNSAIHALSRVRAAPDDRQLLASAIQLLFQSILGIRPVTVRIQVGRPITVAYRGPEASRDLHAEVLAEMKCLIANSPRGPWIGAL